MTDYYLLLIKSSPDYSQALLDLAQKHIEQAGPFTGIGNTESFDTETMMIKARVDLTWLQSQSWYLNTVEFEEEVTRPTGPLFTAWMEAQAAEADTNADGQTDTNTERRGFWQNVLSILRGQ